MGINTTAFRYGLGILFEVKKLRTLYAFLGNLIHKRNGY